MNIDDYSKHKTNYRLFPPVSIQYQKHTDSRTARIPSKKKVPQENKPALMNETVEPGLNIIKECIQNSPVPLPIGIVQDIATEVFVQQGDDPLAFVNFIRQLRMLGSDMSATCEMQQIEEAAKNREAFDRIANAPFSSRDILPTPIPESGIHVDEDDGNDRCTECGSTQTYPQLEQLRSADEPENVVLTCYDCHSKRIIA